MFAPDRLYVIKWHLQAMFINQSTCFRSELRRSLFKSVFYFFLLSSSFSFSRLYFPLLNYRWSCPTNIIDFYICSVVKCLSSILLDKCCLFVLVNFIIIDDLCSLLEVSWPVSCTCTCLLVVISIPKILIINYVSINRPFSR